MLQNLCKTLGFKKNMVYKIPPGGGGGKPYPASGLIYLMLISTKQNVMLTKYYKNLTDMVNVIINYKF